MIFSENRFPLFGIMLVGKICRLRAESAGAADPIGPPFPFNILKSLDNLYGMGIAMVSPRDRPRRSLWATGISIVEKSHGSVRRSYICGEWFAGASLRHAEEAPRNSTAASSLRSVSTLDALMALQGVDDPAERKKRALAKGRNALDVLDTLKFGLIDGSVDGSTLARLKVVGEGLTEGSGDSGLDTVLGEIDLRVAVELAKAGIR
jgi:hypothetical protein